MLTNIFFLFSFCLLPTSIQQYPVDIDSDLVNRKNPNTADDNNRIDLNIGQTQNNLPTDRSSSGGSTSSGSGLGGEVLIMNKEDRTASFFAQPGMLAGEYPLIMNFIINYLNFINGKSPSFSNHRWCCCRLIIFHSSCYVYSL